MNTIRPFKFIIQVVMLEQDSEGIPIGEKISEPAVVYGIEGLKTFVTNFASQNNGEGELIVKPEIVMPE